MNKPAPKEPSMDEILSSIRQIIADDDASSGARRPTPTFTAEATPAPAHSFDPPPAPAYVPPTREEPLALSADQIVVDRAISAPVEPVADFSFSSVLGDSMIEEEATLVDPEDISFEIEAEEIVPEPEPEPVRQAAPPPPASVVRQSAPAPTPEPIRPAQSVSQAAPLPDPTLTTDIAEQLLEPTAGAATRQAFSRLSKLGVGTEGLTLETMVRDLLRPMLKDWLDENLPAVVERLVEKEIARVSRGGFE